MKRLGALLAVLTVANLAFAQGRTQVYSPTDGGFTVRFPSKPREKSETVKSSIGDLKVVTATYATSDGNAYLVSYADFPEAAAKPENRSAMYDEVRDGLKGKDGNILSDTRLDFGPNKVPGREIEIENKKEKKRLKYRIVQVENRLFQVAVIGSTSFATGKDADAFFKSFEITK